MRVGNTCIIKHVIILKKDEQHKGLGFREMEVINKVIVIKIGWRFLQDLTVVWIQLLIAKYLATTTFLD